MAITEMVVAFEVGGATIESRTYQPGDVFGALPGAPGADERHPDIHAAGGEEIQFARCIGMSNDITCAASQIANDGSDVD